MSTIFIALQCCQCLIMQVKQQKKSSKKWTCVVCNQKQSVRKVFCQGLMARDVRKFVQAFNMSRNEQTLAPFPEEIHAHSDVNTHKRRTDWSQYTEPDDDDPTHLVVEEPDDITQPRIVTGLPDPLFKKPKLNEYSSGLDGGDTNTSHKPLFSSKNSNNHTTSQANETTKCQLTNAKGVSKWSDYNSEEEEDISTGGKRTRRSLPPMTVASKGNAYMPQDNYDCLEDIEPRKLHSRAGRRAMNWSDQMNREDSNNLADRAPRRHQPLLFKGPSKWSAYITDDDDNINTHLGCKNESFADQTGQCDHGLSTILIDQRVEECIHPDFN